MVHPCESPTVYSVAPAWRGVAAAAMRSSRTVAATVGETASAAMIGLGEDFWSWFYRSFGVIVFAFGNLYLCFLGLLQGWLGRYSSLSNMLYILRIYSSSGMDVYLVKVY